MNAYEEIRICLRVILRSLIFLFRNAKFKKFAIKEAEKVDFNIQVALLMLSNDK